MQKSLGSSHSRPLHELNCHPYSDALWPCMAHDHCVTPKADHQTSEDSRLEDPIDVLEEVQLPRVTAGCIPFRVWFQVLQHRQLLFP